MSCWQEAAFCHHADSRQTLLSVLVGIKLSSICLLLLLLVQVVLCSNRQQQQPAGALVLVESEEIVVLLLASAGQKPPAYSWAPGPSSYKCWPGNSSLFQGPRTS